MLSQAAAVVLALALIFGVCGPARTHAQGLSATGQVMLVRVGTFARTRGTSDAPGLAFRIAGSARTLVIDLDSRANEDGSFASRVQMASFVEEAFRTGRPLTVDYLVVAGDIGLVKSVQAQAEVGARSHTNTSWRFMRTEDF